MMKQRKRRALNTNAVQLRQVNEYGNHRKNKKVQKNFINYRCTVEMGNSGQEKMCSFNIPKSNTFMYRAEMWM